MSEQRSPRGAPGRRSLSDRRAERTGVPAAHTRFLRLDRGRAEREWARYEGTAQRDLFRQLRERFLARHMLPGRWVLDAGAGPGRFTPWVGGPGVSRVALDLSHAMLATGREIAAKRGTFAAPAVDRVRGDAARAPFRPESFAEIALVGNALGFEARAGEALLASVEALVAPGGVLVVEVAPGAGERARYLARLPGRVVRRLLAAPPAAVLPRLQREGFRIEAARHRPGSFRRWTAEELARRWRPPGWHLREVMAVAPALGADPDRLTEVAKEPRAWARLVELEEMLGHEPFRWKDAAAVLLAVEHSPQQANGLVRGGRSLRS